MERYRLKERLRDGQHYLYGDYDVAVIGAGHAGCEAAYVCSKLGHKTILFGMNLDALANLPCNPNIGGTAKGQLVKEVDAMGGLMGEVADEATIQFRMLNRSKGPAVFSPRAQVDRRLYASVMKARLEATSNLHLRQDEIVALLFDDAGKIAAVEARFGGLFTCKRVVICSGTYLNSRIIIGDQSFESGPDNLFPAKALSACLSDLGIQLQRFKTGTPVRVNLNSIDTSQLERQEGEEDCQPFSFRNEDNQAYLGRPQQCCYLTWTNEETHELIRKNLDRAPMFSGLIEGVGPRYCPSIEDKIVRFADKTRHQVFIEPMGQSGYEMYLQGLSTSLPQDVQLAMLRSIAGLEQVHVQRTAYAIEYDCLLPTELSYKLELRNLPGVFTAGQINGTSGYEEAAAQGLMAGLNAARSLAGKEAVVLDRSQAYIGVLIDDLVHKGTQEPYRMMTARAEYRLMLRQDNADRRLTPLAYELGLIDEERYAKFQTKRQQIEAELERVRKTRVLPTKESASLLESLGTSPLQSGVSLADLLRRPQLNYEVLAPLDPERPDLPASVCYAVNVELKYEGYIKVELERIAHYQSLESKKIPADFDYETLKGLRNEAREKLKRYQPSSIAQAKQISGVSPADLSILMVALESKRGG